MLNLVKARIQPLFISVGTAVNVQNAIKQPINQRNCAYVVPVNERPAPSGRDASVGKPLQETIITFGFVIGIQSLNDATGEKGLASLEALRESLRESLFGWSPSNEHEPVNLSNSDLVGFAANGMWWLDRFTTTTWYEGTAS